MMGLRPVMLRAVPWKHLDGKRWAAAQFFRSGGSRFQGTTSSEMLGEEFEIERPGRTSPQSSSSSSSPPQVTREARVHFSAELAADVILEHGVEVGAMSRIGSESRLGVKAIVQRYVEIDDGVSIGDRVTLRRGVCVRSGSCIGSDSIIFENAIVGNPPQDRKYAGGPTRVEIGRGSVLREDAKVERGTELGGGLTYIGDDVLLMSNVYVGHDTHIGDRCVVGNSTSFAGHVLLENDVTIGGHAAVHQRVIIGKESMIGGMTAIRRDVVPYTLVSGNPAEMRGLNLRRLRSRLNRVELRMAQAVYNFLFRSNPSSLIACGVVLPQVESGGVASPTSCLRERARLLGSTQLPLSFSPAIRDILHTITSFITERSTRGIHLPWTESSRHPP